MTQGRWQDWIGRTQVATDRVSDFPARALAAAFDRPQPLSDGDTLPALWSWLYFLPLAAMGELGPDGHPRRGDFLPPIELPRRMWAGSRCTLHAPLTIGQPIERTTTIRNVAEKVGKAGPLAFLTLHHVVRSGSEVVLEEEQDIVYIAIPERYVAPAPTPVPACAWSETVEMSTALLFRFSAVTFNAHRIHYDRPYALEVEKYPGLVVHGPLQAMLLFDAAQRHAPGRRPTHFEFRGVRPQFDFEALRLSGQAREDGGFDLFTSNGEGAVAVQAAIRWAG
ncbi:MAG: MaoC family dehydratase N-terminal domain-containing protein [Hyphomicrobiales bacterium]